MCWQNDIWIFNMTSMIWSVLHRNDASASQQQLWPSNRAYSSMTAYNNQLVHLFYYVYSSFANSNDDVLVRLVYLGRCIL
jgi:hypothetical protein